MAGTVVRFRTTDRNPLTEHEAATQTAVALMLAELTDCDFGGIWDPTFQYRGRLFFVPEEALVVDEAAQLGIASPDDLFGGVVPYRFAKTKALTHALVAPDATRPPGWCDAFTAAVAPAVLPGFTAFTREDAREAASRLLTTGEARIKKTLASGSRGQRVTKTLDAVDAVLETIADDELAECGVVIETNLHDVTTSSVGQVCVDGYAASYVGIQRETCANDGRVVYGGSDLTVVRGGWKALDRLGLDPLTRRAVSHAIRYDAATRELPGFFASRRNYDVAIGVDCTGRQHVGVLEASWRVGGASAAEIIALQTLQRDPRAAVISVSTVERYGGSLPVPGDAVVHFHGTDAVVGPVLRYTRIAERRVA